MDFLSR
jgi:hypothetical protein